MTPDEHWHRIFERFTLHRDGTIDLDALVVDDPTLDVTGFGEYVIVVEPRAEAVRGIDDLCFPVLRREPLGTMGNTGCVAPWSNAPWRTLLREPIRVGVA